MLSAHADTFAREHLPPKESWPVMKGYGVEDIEYPALLNAAVELLDRNVESGSGSRTCLLTDCGVWSYQRLLEYANRFANLLVSQGLVPGERVLLRIVHDVFEVDFYENLLVTIATDERGATGCRKLREPAGQAHELEQAQRLGLRVHTRFQDLTHDVDGILQFAAGRDDDRVFVLDHHVL